MAVNIFDELHSATTEGIVADSKQIRHGSDSTVSAELENKIDFPSGGSDGQVLTLEKHAPVWKDAQSGSSSADKVTFDPSDTSLEGETVQFAVSELANGVALCTDDPGTDGTIDGQLQRHQNDGLHNINPKTKAANVSFEKGSTGMSAETAQAAIEELNTKKQSTRETLTPTYDESVAGYVLEITESSKPGVVDWRGQTGDLYVTVANCQNEILVYFDGSSAIYDDAASRLCDAVEIENDKTYVASYLDGIVAICEIQAVE